MGASVLGGVTTANTTLGGVMVGLDRRRRLADPLGHVRLQTSSRTGSRRDWADLGLGVDDLAYNERQPPASVVTTGISANGLPIIVTTLGRDSWSSRRWTTRWRHAV